MHVSNSNLNNGLKQLSLRIHLLVPKLLKGIMRFIPSPGVEQLQGLGETRIVNQAQRLAIFLAGSLRRRMDSGVTSSISSGPMYSSARSSVI